MWEGPQSEAKIKVIIRQVLEALKYLHGKNIAHLDINPANLLLTPDLRVKLADFGIA